MTECRAPRTPAPPDYPSSSVDSPGEFVLHATTPTPYPGEIPAVVPQVFCLGVNGQMHTCTLHGNRFEDESVTRVNESKSRTVGLVCTHKYVVALSGLGVAVYDQNTRTQRWRRNVEVPPGERPLSRVMGAIVDGETLFVCAGYHMFMNRLPDGFQIWDGSLKDYVPPGTGPSFSTLLLCNRSMFFGLPTMCVCISRNADPIVLWVRRLSTGARPRSSPISEPGLIPTFAALSDEQVMACCGGCAYAISTANGNNTSEPLILAPEWHGPMLTLYDKAFDKGRAFVLVRDTLWAISVYDAFKEDCCLKVFPHLMDSQQISMAWDPQHKLIFVAGHGVLVCVNGIRLEIMWRVRYNPDDRSALVLRYDEHLQLLVFCISSRVCMFNPHDGTRVLTLKLPPFEPHSYCVTLCTPESSYDINASGFLHNNFIAAQKEFM